MRYILFSSPFLGGSAFPVFCNMDAGGNSLDVMKVIYNLQAVFLITL